MNEELLATIPSSEHSSEAIILNVNHSSASLEREAKENEQQPSTVARYKRIPEVSIAAAEIVEE